MESKLILSLTGDFNNRFYIIKCKKRFLKLLAYIDFIYLKNVKINQLNWSNLLRTPVYINKLYFFIANCVLHAAQIDSFGELFFVSRTEGLSFFKKEIIYGNMKSKDSFPSFSCKFISNNTYGGKHLYRANSAKI